MLKDEQLKTYFLGKMPEVEAERFEEEIAASAELTERAQIVESELLDEYLCGTLSASETELFEAVYLTTEARRENLRLAESLWKVANEREINNVAADKPHHSFWQNWTAWRIALAGFAALLLFGAVGFWWLSSGRKAEIVEQKNTNQTPTPKAENQNIRTVQNINTANQNGDVSTDSNLQINKNAAPTPAAKPTPTPKTVEQPAPALATFMLLPKTLRSDGEQFIKISPNTNKISLRLNLPKAAGKYQIFAATVKTADGETVFTFPNLKSLNLIFSADKLENRTYIVFLEGQNAQNTPEPVAEYTFRVRR